MVKQVRKLLKVFKILRPRFQGDNFECNMKIVEQVKEIAIRQAATPGQIALAWLLHQGNDIVPIPGTKRVSYIEENASSSQISLSSEELSQLNDIAPVGKTSGDRYTPERMSWIDAN
jgi:aryl-alcohol dehydrogenase-like predicted oxidoreductase